jgi:hypothetical protein
MDRSLPPLLRLGIDQLHGDAMKIVRDSTFVKSFFPRGHRSGAHKVYGKGAPRFYSASLVRLVRQDSLHHVRALCMSRLTFPRSSLFPAQSSSSMSPKLGTVVSRVWISVSGFLQCRSGNNRWLAAIQESSGFSRTIPVIKTSRNCPALHVQHDEPRLGAVLHRVMRVTLGLGRAQEPPRVRTVHRPSLRLLIDSQHSGSLGSRDVGQNPFRGADRRAAVLSLFRSGLKANTSLSWLRQSGSCISKMRLSFEFERTE